MVERGTDDAGGQRDGRDPGAVASLPGAVFGDHGVPITAPLGSLIVGGQDLDEVAESLVEVGQARGIGRIAV